MDMQGDRDQHDEKRDQRWEGQEMEGSEFSQGTLIFLIRSMEGIKELEEGTKLGT